MHTNTTDTAVPGRQIIDQATIPTISTEATYSLTNTNILNNKTGHASQDESPLSISQLNPNKEITPKLKKMKAERYIMKQKN